ncbi:MAG: Eco29kI family restriction endonuclease [Tessaracoccus sp.]|uniref:Eco29kI family restriction endonuclease n=1 Tax=Tessaracoccus sp. TaxID=1971211 RepID=UPI001ECED08B|nr:Eco29kI family restriction endonuclease [Tessaracoccus sp.]MBK7823250.1 Eco29kI family restriction endonuclease [Tessaracoccus sp.]
MTSPNEYNPLDYQNLTKHCVDELMRRGPFELPLEQDFFGAGVYALFYTGDDPVYAKIRSPDAEWPIYVGKAVPPGGRKGGGKPAAQSKSLSGRLAEHTASIKAASNLSIDDFLCRYLVVTPLWITMAERFLIEHYLPLWNIGMDGFGNHDPGSGRHAGEITWWDALHPGRSWAKKLSQTKTPASAQAHLKKLLANYETTPKAVSLEDIEPHEDE